jgi:hypothetical protein
MSTDRQILAMVVSSAELPAYARGSAQWARQQLLDGESPSEHFLVTDANLVAEWKNTIANSQLNWDKIEL